MICSACQEWIDPVIEAETRTQKCPECGLIERLKTVPLFIITGTSGVGKTAILSDLRSLLPSWDIFETDILWDSGGSWDFVWSNWLRIAHSLSESERPVILSGTVLPERIDACDSRHGFDPIHYLALHCDDATREARLRARPAWRGWTDERIEERRNFAQWLLDHAESDFDPPLSVVDTSRETVRETAVEVRDWALERWEAWTTNTWKRKRHIIQLSPYQSTWPEKFRIEKEKLEVVFGDAALEIEHIGSTSVAELASKPIVDMAVMIESHRDADGFTEALARIGYEFHSSLCWNISPSRAERHFYTRGDPIEYHLSIAYTDRGGYWPRQILFRDYLRSHPEARDEYAKLKEALLRQDPSGEGYTPGKTDFIYQILRLAGWREGQKYGE